MDRNLVGRKIVLELEEHPYKKKFSATIMGKASISIREVPSDRFYLLKLEGEAAKQLSHDYVLFYSGTIDLKTPPFQRIIAPGISLRTVSLERFVLDRSPAYPSLPGKLYGFPKTTSLDSIVLSEGELFILGRCRVVQNVAGHRNFLANCFRGLSLARKHEHEKGDKERILD